jgi:NIMA (never in mitosis gene a)-related kinase
VWQDKYTQKSDIWSLGVILYETLALKLPFIAPDMKSLQRKIEKNEALRIPAHFSDDIWSLVKSMLHKNPEQRPTCEQLCNS